MSGVVWMYCLLSTEDKDPVGLFGRIKRGLSGDKGLIIRETVVLGVRVLGITIEVFPGMKTEDVRAAIRRAVDAMRRERVREICFAKNFPYRALFLREGFDEMGSLLLMTTLAGRISSYLGGQISAVSGDGKYAAIFAAKLTVAVLRTLSELCASFKYLMVTTESGGGREFEALRRRTGISVIERPTPRQLMNADVAVVFGPLRRSVLLPAKCIAFGIGDNALSGVDCGRVVSGLRLELAAGREERLPEIFSRDVLISAALCAGTLKADDIVLRDVLLAEGG
jgi:hypothetical protein